MRPIIEAKELSKLYRIGKKEQGYRTFREAIIEGLKAPFHNFRRLRDLTRFNGESTCMKDARSQDDLIWALRDVSFEVQPGEVVGIIGRNGAGKSTLLKILSRITEPTSGEVKIHGRVASLLEVGTGFHPELTGRENIYLNGTILGMRKAEIARKFDEIVDFAEVERFIDTPVKHYSSGMYVRLAFAIAAHLDPEILLVDEVLAVGDAEFQQKCLGKMSEVSKTGRTILFVSHNMLSIRRLCDQCMLLSNGKIEVKSTTEYVINGYLDTIQNTTREIQNNCRKATYIKNIAIYDKNKKPTIILGYYNEYALNITIVAQNTHNLHFGFTIFNSEGIGLLSSISSFNIEAIPNGVSELSIVLPSSLLHPGKYRIEGALGEPGIIHEQCDNYVSFYCMRDDKFYLEGNKSIGLLRITNQWELLS
jgi:lipopolysaccharide transport system ATP-binding protein